MKSIITAVLIFMIIHSVSSQTLNIKPNSMGEADKDHKYNVSANYPVIDFGPDALMGVRGIASDINSEIKKMLTEIINPFKEQSTTDTLPCPQPDNTLEINYTTVNKSNGYLCFMFETFSDPRCAAHPMTYRTSFNYSYTTKGLLAIDSLFSPGSGWLEFISDYCIKELRSRAKRDQLENIDDMITGGASAKSDNFRVFTVNEQTLDIVFNPYRVGPYVWGIQTVNIPMKGLLKMLDPKGPLGFMIK